MRRIREQIYGNQTPEYVRGMRAGFIKSVHLLLIFTCCYLAAIFGRMCAWGWAAIFLIAGLALAACFAYGLPEDHEDTWEEDEHVC